MSNAYDSYSEATGQQIDAKFTDFSFGTNIRGLTNKDNPFRRSNTMFMPSTQDTLYPGLYIPPCTFETQCCNQPPTSSITVHGRLKDCYDANFSESLARWTYNTNRPPHAKAYTTGKVGFDATEN